MKSLPITIRFLIKYQRIAEDRSKELVDSLIKGREGKKL